MSSASPNRLFDKKNKKVLRRSSSNVQLNQQTSERTAAFNSVNRLLNTTVSSQLTWTKAKGKHIYSPPIRGVHLSLSTSLNLLNNWHKDGNVQEPRPYTINNINNIHKYMFELSEHRVNNKKYHVKGWPTKHTQVTMIRKALCCRLSSKTTFNTGKVDIRLTPNWMTCAELAL